jgi:LPS export ABC transporter permease LptF
MTLLDRYVGRQLLVTALFAVAVLSVVLVLGNVFKQLLELLVNHDAPLDLILSFIAYILPFSLTFTIPWGFLTAVLLVFGKLSAENELIALRSSGISVPRVCATVFGLAIISAATCLWINVDVAPKAQVAMKDALYRIATNNPLAMFGSDKIITEFPGRKIYVERNEGAELFNLLVYELNEEEEPMRVVFAKKGRLETDGQNKRLLLHIYDARFEQRDEDEPGNLSKIRQGITMQQSTWPISLEELYEKNQKRRGLSGMTVGELLTRLNEPGSGGEAPKELTPEEKAAAFTEVNKRFSFSLASLAFALIGVPLAITAHRKETSIGFLLSLVIAFVYFFFIILADTLRNNPAARPELLVWLPNVLFLSIGVWLFVRLARR